MYSKERTIRGTIERPADDDYNVGYFITARRKVIYHREQKKE